MKIKIAVLFYGVVLAFSCIGCGSGTSTSEVEVTPYDQSVEDRMAERGREMMSEAERRKAEK